MSCISFCESWTRDPGFDTIQAAAETFPAAFQIFQFRHCIMAPFAADPTRALYQLAINDNSTPYAGPDNNAKDDRAIFPCAIRSLGKGKAICIVS